MADFASAKTLSASTCLGDTPFKPDIPVENDMHITIVWHFDTPVVDASHLIKQSTLPNATMKPSMMACR
jgi:hypothetical protein